MCGTSKHWLSLIDCRQIGASSYYRKERRGHMKVEQVGEQKTTFIILNLIIPPISNLEPPHTRICSSTFMHIQRVYAKCTLCLASLEVRTSAVNIWAIAAVSLCEREHCKCCSLLPEDVLAETPCQHSLLFESELNAYIVPGFRIGPRLLWSQTALWVARSADGG